MNGGRKRGTTRTQDRMDLPGGGVARTTEVKTNAAKKIPDRYGWSGHRR